jgi:6-phosphogluconolactonase
LDDVQLVGDVPAAFAGLVREERPATLALSGGDTARRCYEHLAGFADLDWSAMEVLIGDERWVPVDAPDSNEGMVRQVLLDRVGADKVHSARDAGRTPEEAAAAYDRVVGRLSPLDLVHLGLGEDGHTASLFPGSPALAEVERLVVATGDDQHPHERLTLTYPALARARLVVFTVEGEDKRDALARVRNGDDVPAARVRAERVVWLVDPAAAGLTGGRG